MVGTIQSEGEGILAKCVVLPGLLSIRCLGITEANLGDSAQDQLILMPKLSKQPSKTFGFRSGRVVAEEECEVCGGLFFVLN